VGRHEPPAPRVRQFRHRAADGPHLPGLHHERRQVGLRKVPVIVGFLLAAHRDGHAGRRIPQSGLLHDAPPFGEQVDLFVLQERDSQEPQAIATIPRGLAANDAPNVPATLWSDDNKRLDVGDITLAQAITWDQQDLDTGARKNDDVQFVNAKLGYGFSPLMSRAKLSEEREFSLLFALNGAGCDKQLGDEQLKFASLKCSKAATTKASGIFVSLKKRDKQAPDDPSIYLLQFLADYLLSGETESDPPRNATR